MKVLTVEDKVASVGIENEPRVDIADTKLTKEELNRGCPLGVSRVIDSVYICGAHALPGAVKALRPGLVINAAPELPPPPEDYVPRHYVPLLDTPNSDMYPFMELVADLIHEVVTRNEVVLVHCVAGVSRSVTLCLAYLVKWQKMTLCEAYHHMKLRRPQIRPNTGFFKQLIKFEERLFGEASVKMVYCEAIDKEIPDVYEADYRGMTWFRQRPHMVCGLVELPGYTIWINLETLSLSCLKSFWTITDNWYTNIPLAEYLLSRKTNICGTLRKKRKNL